MQMYMLVNDDVLDRAHRKRYQVFSAYPPPRAPPNISSKYVNYQYWKQNRKKTCYNALNNCFMSSLPRNSTLQIRVTGFQNLDFVASAVQSAGEPSTGLALLDRCSIVILGDLTRVWTCLNDTKHMNLRYQEKE